MSNENEVPKEENLGVTPAVTDSDYPTLDVPGFDETPKEEAEPTPTQPEETSEDDLSVTEVDDEIPSEKTVNNLMMVNQQVTLSRTATSKLEVDASTTVSLPNATAEELTAVSDRLGQLISYESSPRNLHEEVMANMVNHMLLGDVFTGRLAEEGTDWQQSVEIDGKRIQPSRPVYKTGEGGEKLTGSEAMREMDKNYGLGGHFVIPLVHSGVWLSLKPSTNLEYASLDEKLRTEKDDFGKRTLGMVFSNNKTYIVNHLMDFIEAHVQSCSVIDWEDIGLRNILKITDLLVLAAAMGYTLYPNGFEYVSACTGSTDCDHIYNGKLKIPNCIWFDRKSLTKSQKTFMGDRMAKRTFEEVQNYQEESQDVDNSFEVGENIRVFFKVPTIGQNITSGYRWFEDMEQTIIQAFGANLERDKSNEYMTKRIGLSILRQYGHFFKTIQFVDSGNYIEDDDDISEALVRLSGVHDILDDTLQGVGKYIEKQTKAIVAIPRYNCPECGQPQTQQMEEHPMLIPIDPVNLFFTLGDQKKQYGSQN